MTDELGEAADRALYSPPAETRPAALPGGHWADDLADLTVGEIVTGSALAACVYAAAMFGVKLLARAVRA